MNNEPFDTLYPPPVFTFRLFRLGDNYSDTGGDLGIIKPEDTPRVIAEILSEGVDILLSGNTGSRPIALNTKYGVVILEQKIIDQVTSYSVVSAYGKKNITGTVIGQLIKPS